MAGYPVSDIRYVVGFIYRVDDDDNFPYKKAPFASMIR